VTIEQLLEELRLCPPFEDSPLPFRADDSIVRAANGNAVAQWVGDEDAHCIAARVTATPVLVAEIERLQKELSAAKFELDVAKNMVRESFTVAFEQGAPPHCTLEEAMEYVVEAPRKEVERLRAEVESERQAGVTLGAALLAKLEGILERLEETKAAVERMDIFYHRQGCPLGACNCGADTSNEALTTTRLVLGTRKKDTP
jgi:hypothetical protein